MYCWGSSSYRQTGWTTAITPRATQVLNLPVGDIKQVAADDLHTCSATNTTLECWGSDENGTLGDGEDDGEDDGVAHLTPTPILTGERLVDLSAGFRYTCAVDDTRHVRCWGANTYGGLGDGTMTDRHAPTPIAAAAFCPAF